MTQFLDLEAGEKKGPDSSEEDQEPRVEEVEVEDSEEYKVGENSE